MYFGTGFDSLLYSIRQEWVIFLLIFVIAFTMTYLGLVKFFVGYEKRSDLSMQRSGSGDRYRKIVQNKGMVVLLSMAVGLLVAIGMTQSPWLLEYVGEWAGWMMFVFAAILFVILIAPFYKALKANIGKTPAMLFSVAIIWGMLYYIYNESDLIYSLSYRVVDTLSSLASFWSLFVLLLIGAIVSRVMK